MTHEYIDHRILGRGLSQDCFIFFHYALVFVKQFTTSPFGAMQFDQALIKILNGSAIDVAIERWK